MKRRKPPAATPWLKTQYANLIRYVPSGGYYARIRIRGKLVVKSLKTKTISVAKLRLSDLEKDERQAAKIVTNLKGGSVNTEPDREIIALIAYLQRLGTDIKAQPATAAAKP